MATHCSCGRFCKRGQTRCSRCLNSAPGVPQDRAHDIAPAEMAPPVADASYAILAIGRDRIDPVPSLRCEVGTAPTSADAMVAWTLRRECLSSADRRRIAAAGRMESQCVTHGITHRPSFASFALWAGTVAAAAIYALHLGIL